VLWLCTSAHTFLALVSTCSKFSINPTVGSKSVGTPSSGGVTGLGRSGLGWKRALARAYTPRAGQFAGTKITCKSSKPEEGKITAYQVEGEATTTAITSEVSSLQSITRQQYDYNMSTTNDTISCSRSMHAKPRQEPVTLTTKVHTFIVTGQPDNVVDGLCQCAC